jgi:hypothetical protein
MSDWSRFNSQFRETHEERSARLRKSYLRRLAREKESATAHTAVIDNRSSTPRRDPYAIDATKCKCGSDQFHVQVLASATFQGGTFVAFDYSEEVIPMKTIAVCAECGTERVIDGGG